MSHGVYRMSVTGRRVEIAGQLRSVENTIAQLHDTRSRYAQELLAMRDLYRRVQGIWDAAPNDLPEAEEPPCPTD